jgi:hypothetical protein
VNGARKQRESESEQGGGLTHEDMDKKPAREGWAQGKPQHGLPEHDRKRRGTEEQ